MSCCCFGGKGGDEYFLCAFTKKKFPNDIANAAPHPPVFCYKAGIYSKTEWIKSQRRWRVSRPILKCAGKNCKGHVLSIPGTLNTQGALPTSRVLHKNHFLNPRGNKTCCSQLIFHLSMLTFKFFPNHNEI